MINKIQKVKILSWGLAGVNYDYQQEGYGNCSCMTYLGEDYFLEMFESGKYQKDHPNTIFSGACVIDKSKVLENKTHLAYKAPLIDVNMHPRHVKRFVNNVEFDVGDLESKDIFSIVEVNFKMKNIGSLDYVGAEIYAEWWRRHGARVGKVQDDNQTIIWKPMKYVRDDSENSDEDDKNQLPLIF